MHCLESISNIQTIFQALEWLDKRSASRAGALIPDNNRSIGATLQLVDIHTTLQIGNVSKSHWRKTCNKNQQ